MGCRELVEVVDVSKDTGKIFYFENRYILFLRNLEVGGMAAQSTDEREEPLKELPFSKSGFGKWSFLHPVGRPNRGIDLLFDN